MGVNVVRSSLRGGRTYGIYQTLLINKQLTSSQNAVEPRLSRGLIGWLRLTYFWVGSNG
jgi:hypothetical protein